MLGRRGALFSRHAESIARRPSNSGLVQVWSGVSIRKRCGASAITPKPRKVWPLICQTALTNLSVFVHGLQSCSCHRGPAGGFLSPGNSSPNFTWPVDNLPKPERKSCRFWRPRYRPNHQRSPPLTAIRPQSRDERLASRGPHLLCGESPGAE
jgi:hypothetical protein